MEKNLLQGHILALLCTLFWGTAYIASKALINLGLAPVQIIICRQGLAYLLLCLITRKYLPLGGIQGLKRDRYLIIAGLLGTGMYYLLENSALDYTYATNVSLLVTTSPLVSAWFNRFLPGAQKTGLNRRFHIGMLCCLAGAALVIFNGNFVLKLNPLGDVLGLLAAVDWAGYSFFLSKAMAANEQSEQPLSPLLLTRRTLFFGWLLVLAAYPLLGDGFDPALFTPQGLLPLSYLALFPSCCAFLFWGRAIAKIGMMRASVYIYFSPVVVIVASFLLLDEHLTLVSGAGAALILSGLLLSQGLPGRKRRQPVNADEAA